MEDRVELIQYDILLFMLKFLELHKDISVDGNKVFLQLYDDLWRYHGSVLDVSELMAKEKLLSQLESIATVSAYYPDSVYAAYVCLTKY